MRSNKESELSRRNFVSALAAAGLAAFAIRPRSAHAAIIRTDLSTLPPYGNGTLPSGIRSRTVSDVNGLTVHLLEAGFDPPGRPAVLLLHGFPELAYSWRKVMLPLASAGYHVIAPDKRGFGRTTGWDDAYDADLDEFSILNQTQDVLALVWALGYRGVSAVIGHDQGSRTAAWCALIRPDVFRSVVMISTPFPGPPTLPFDTVDHPRRNGSAQMAPGVTIEERLAALNPPRKYYQRYYTTRAANGNLQNPPQGLHAFWRAYYHVKSADWKQNKPFPLKSNSAEELAKLPRYYVMDLDKGMAETVAPEMPSASEIAACKWLTDDELGVYTTEYARTGFQGGLDVYRTYYEPKLLAELQLFSDATIDVPSCFIGGMSDWGVYQTPGALEAMSTKVCTQFRGVHLVEGAGHWVQQEQPGRVQELLVQFLKQQAPLHQKA
jgi:pimeloyl-ACP methyl ester carboxylesterase